MKKIALFVMIISLFSSLFASQKIISSGEILVNGKKLNKSTVIKVGDFIETKKNSRIKFNIGTSAFLAKGKAKFQLEQNGNKQTLDVLAGGVLAVFKKGQGKHEVKTPNMTAGIRGTGVYLEHKDGKSYFCTCYGQTDLKTDKEHVHLEATHHNMLWVKDKGQTVPETRMVGHTDEELRELEAFVGRIPEFDK